MRPMLAVAAAYGTARLAVMGFIDDVMDNAEADTESDGGTEPPATTTSLRRFHRRAITGRIVPEV